MPERIKSLIYLVVISILFFAYICADAIEERRAQAKPPAQVEQLQADSQALQAEVSQLRAEMEDLRSVQGYVVWQKDWRNNREP